MALRKNKELKILLADEGWATVVMDNTQYMEKLKTLLGDRETYEIRDKDPIAQLKNKMVEELEKGRKDG